MKLFEREQHKQLAKVIKYQVTKENTYRFYRNRAKHAVWDQQKLSRCGFLHWTLSSYHATDIQLDLDQRECVWKAHGLAPGCR